MLLAYQEGYFTTPNVSSVKRLVQLSGEYFEWTLVLGLLLGFIISSWHDTQITKRVVEQPQRNDFF